MRVQSWMEQVGDPLLQGPVPCADPAKVGYDCVWGKFRPHAPEKEEFGFRIIKNREFGEQTL